MRYLLLSGLLAASTLFMGISGCPIPGDDDDDTPPPTPTPCKVPGDGEFLPAGGWGGEHWSWQISKDGYIALETDCAHGKTEYAVGAYEGQFKFQVWMYPEGGPVTYPPQDNAYQATVYGEICSDYIWFSMSAEGFETKGEIFYGKEPQLFKCL